MANQRKSEIYQVWRNMRRRCSDTSRPEYRRYSGRGISVCRRWEESFAAFASDMGPRPTGAQIERLDNTGNYEPTNCRWASRKEQARNRKTTKFVTWRGETLPVAAWAERLGIPQDTLHHRLERGSVERALSTPLKRRSA